MSFAVAAEAYDRFMGRYSTPLGPALMDLAGVEPGQRVLDVGCGPGALTTQLVTRLGADAVAAVDPSQPFVEAARERHPDITVELGVAEDLPFGDGEFDAALAQLVVHFMTDALAGLRDMARVTRSGGVVAATVWDHGGRQGPPSLFWEAARELHADVEDEARRPGTHRGQLTALFRAAGLDGVEETSISSSVEHPSFEDWWEPYTLGVGPAGALVASLGDEARSELRERCRDKLPAAPFTVTARAWAARGVSPGP